MDQAFLEWVVGQTGLAGLAAFALWMMRQAYMDRDRSIKQAYDDREKAIEDNLIRERQNGDLLIQVVQANTEASTKLMAMFERFQEIVGNCSIAQRVSAANPASVRERPDRS